MNEDHSAMSGDNSDANGRFQLLTSPVATSRKDVWELATDTLLRDIYGSEGVGISQINMAPMNESDDDLTWTSASTADDNSLSSGSPFDFVDLDIEIEEPFQLDGGLNTATAYFNNQVDSSTATTWPSLLTSLVSAQ